MGAGKILNTSHSLYADITRAFSGDKILPKLVALKGGSDTVEQTYHYLESDPTGMTNVDAQQGFARNDTHWFKWNRTFMHRFDLTNTYVDGIGDTTNNIPIADKNGAGTVDANYVYTPLSKWNDTNQNYDQTVIARHNLSDLSYVDYFDTTDDNINGNSGMCIGHDGTELVVCSFELDFGDVPRNTIIKRWDINTGAKVGEYTIAPAEAGCGYQDIEYHNGHYYLNSYHQATNTNRIYMYKLSGTALELVTIIDPIGSSTELEGLESWNGNLYFNHYEGEPRLLDESNLVITTNETNSQPVKFLENTDMGEEGTLLFDVKFLSLFNWNVIFDNIDDSSDWESWTEEDGDIMFRIAGGNHVRLTAGANTNDYFKLAMMWKRTGSTATVKLGVNGVITEVKLDSPWVAPPTNGLWLAGANTSNMQGGNIYRNVIHLDRMLDEAELPSNDAEFDAFYDAEGMSPQGVTTITGVTPSSTTASVSYSYDDTDHAGFKYRLDGGAFVDINLDNPINITGLTEDTNYTIEVVAYNASGDSTVSAPFNFSTSAAPSVPDAPAISAIGGDQIISIIWSAVPNSTGYKTFLDGVPTDVGNVTSHLYTGLNNGQSYEVYAVAYNAQGDSLDSNKINVTPQASSATDDGMIKPMVKSMVSTLINKQLRN